MLEEESVKRMHGAVGAPDGVRIVLRQYRKIEDARANRLELLVSQVVLSELDVVRDLRQDPKLKHGFELLTMNVEECPETSIWSSSAATLRSPRADQETGLHSLRLAADDAATHTQWITALSASVSRLIVQAHKHYPNGSPLQEQRHRVVPSGVVEAAHAQAYQRTRHMEENGCSPIRAKVVPIQYYSSLYQVPSADAPAKTFDARDFRGYIDNGSDNASADSDNQDTASRPSDVTTDRADEQDSRRLNDSEAKITHNLTRERSWECERLSSNNGSEYSVGNQAESHSDDDGGDNQQDDRYSELSDLVPEPPVAVEHFTQQPARHDHETSQINNEHRESRIQPTNHEAAARAGKIAPARRAGTSDEDCDDSSDSSNNSSDYTNTSTDGNASIHRSATASSVVPHSRGAFASQFHRTDLTALFPFQRAQTHTFNSGGQVFTLDTRYRLLKSVGNGAYGAVIAVKDAVANKNVAVKKITNIFEDLVDAKRILREIRLLRHFDHKNITRLLDLAPPPSKKHFEDMYIITELMETDLHQVIYSMQPMSDDHVKYFLYQMLCALHHIHSSGVLHRDMKPSNILLNSNCDLKICDFGLARGGLGATSELPELTEYVVTRWYRAPEIMLNCLHYTEAIDVWAVGCIFAEMLLREPLFPGNDYIHQLKLIIKFLGTPKQEDIAFVKNVKALRFLAKLSISKPKKWRDVFSGNDVNPLAIDLLTRMLMFNPAKRISVEEALQHPYLATFYDAVDITPSPPFDFSFDLPDDELSKEALVDLLCEDVEHFHPSLAALIPPPAVSGSSSRFFRMGMTASAS